jgi:uncharacterized protein YdiU (UPF0061 family)
MPPRPEFRPATVHAELGPDLFDVVAPAEFPRHDLRYRNQAWAARVGLDTLDEAEWTAHFGRFEPLPASFEAPLSLRYHGHQFRTYNPELGDGRGFLFAQMHDLKDDRLLDFGTKGSGTTPWSRGGDGRLTLKGGVREVLATTMLEALGVNTSKSFSLIETGEKLTRGDEPSPTRSAVLVRLSHSHIRIGSFQRLSFLQDIAGLQRLLDHSIRHYMPEVWHDDLAARATGFLAEVTARVARTGGQWMAAGFVHGVLNTDNINISGESFDYGPWRFLPTNDPEFTAAYFDQNGLYAYGRQPETLLWNLARLAGCLLAFADKPSLETALAPFWGMMQTSFVATIIRRLGLQSQTLQRDAELARALHSFLFESQAPFEQTMFDWFGGLQAEARATTGPNAAHYDHPSFAAVRAALQGYTANPALPVGHRYFTRATPATLLIDEVEALWAPIAEHDDWSKFNAKLADIAELAEATANAPAGV